MIGVLTVAGAVLLAASILYAGKRFRMKRKSVETEQREVQEVVSSAPQWPMESDGYDMLAAVRESRGI